MLIKSESTKVINGAILKAQAAFPIVGKTKENDFYKRNGKGSMYAGYDDIYAAIKPILNQNGIIVEHEHNMEYKDIEAQVMYRGDQDVSGVTQALSIAEVIVTTTIIHVESGEFKSIHSSTFPDRSNMHGVMAAVTYLKRYNLTSMLDIAVGGEDDDGNGGLNKPEDQIGQRQARQTRTRGKPADMQVTGQSGVTTRQTPFMTGSGKPINMQQATSGLKPEDLEPQPGDLPFDDEPPVEAESTVMQPPVDSARPMTDAERKRTGLIGKEKINNLIALCKKSNIIPKMMTGYLEAEYGYKSISEIKEGEEFGNIYNTVLNNPEIIINPGAQQ